MRKLGPGVMYVFNPTSQQLKPCTALACACEVCILVNLGPAESGSTTAGIKGTKHACAYLSS